MEQYPLLIILGATASGKTKLAVRLAEKLHTEIISADSRQVFRDMDIGTGKDLEEYGNVPYHLINIRAAGENYNVNAFKDDFYRVFTKLSQQQKLPILCGGTGMYIHSILQNHEFTTIPVNENLRINLSGLSKTELQRNLETYPAASIAHADLSSAKRLIRAIEVAEYLQHHELIVSQRPAINSLVIGLVDEVENRRAKIIKRLHARLEAGLIAEVKTLLAHGVSAEQLTFYGLEYKFVTAYVRGEMNYNTLVERLSIAICQFAKRQQTFFRKMEKDGVKIQWLPAQEEISFLESASMKLIDQQFHLK